MIFIHPGGTMWWISTRVRDPVTTTTGKMAALLPAPRSPCALLQPVTALPWAPLTRLCLSTLAPSGIVRAAHRPLVPGFLHTTRVLLHHVAALLLVYPVGWPSCSPLCGRVCLWACMSVGVYVCGRVHHTLSSHSPEEGRVHPSSLWVLRIKLLLRSRIRVQGSVWPHLLSLSHVSGLGFLAHEVSVPV